MFYLESNWLIKKGPKKCQIQILNDHGLLKVVDSIFYFLSVLNQYRSSQKFLYSSNIGIIKPVSPFHSFIQNVKNFLLILNLLERAHIIIHKSMEIKE